MAYAHALRMRATAEMRAVRGRRCGRSRKYSGVCRFLASGYVAGSATPPSTSMAAAASSMGWPLAGDLTTAPRTRKDACTPPAAAAAAKPSVLPASATTCRLSATEPSLSAMKSSLPAPASRTVRAQPHTVTSAPASASPASSTSATR